VKTANLGLMNKDGWEGEDEDGDDEDGEGVWMTMQTMEIFKMLIENKWYESDDGDDDHDQDDDGK